MTALSVSFACLRFESKFQRRAKAEIHRHISRAKFNAVILRKCSNEKARRWIFRRGFSHSPFSDDSAFESLSVYNCVWLMIASKDNVSEKWRAAGKKKLKKKTPTPPMPKRLFAQTEESLIKTLFILNFFIFFFVERSRCTPCIVSWSSITRQASNSKVFLARFLAKDICFHGDRMLDEKIQYRHSRCADRC